MTKSKDICLVDPLRKPRTSADKNAKIIDTLENKETGDDKNDGAT